MKKRRPIPKNPLATLGSPFFQLFILAIAIIASFILLLGRFRKKIGQPKFSLLSLNHLDSFITSLLSSWYSIKTTGKKKLVAAPVRRHRIYPPIFSTRIFAVLATFSLFAFFIYTNILSSLPSPKDLTNRRQKLTTQILDRNGRVLYKIYQDENRTPIKLASLPLYVKNAFIAIEDNGFYTHSGFRLTSIIRAILHNLSPANLKCQISNIKCPIEGGSTITQQLVKNALLSPERTWQRKAKELLLAIAVESTYDKDSILEMYLNEVGFGGPAYGIQEASAQYFGKNAADLSLAEAAFLAGLPKAPSKFSPYINPELAKSRQGIVLNLMRKEGYITQDMLSAALATPLEFAPTKIEINAPHFVMFVRDLLVDQFGEELVSHGGLKVTTTIDLDLQHRAENYLNEELVKLKGLNVGNGSALITRPGTGEILAMVGSKNYFDIKNDGQVNLTTALRQPGSAIKVVNYALAFEKGATPNTLLKDEPITFNIPGSSLWSPKNYDNRYHGTQTIRSALANSYNIPAVMLLAQNGVMNMVSLGQKMGITTWNEPDRYGLALTLGGAAVKMTDMAVVYGTLANAGKRVPLNPIIRVEDSTGRGLTFDICLVTSNCKEEQVITKETAFFLSDILSDNAARSAAFGYRSILNIEPHRAAVKTGTSNDLRDNWTFGYTPDFLVTTWVGNNDNSPMSRVTSGITGASPVWSKIMKDLLANNPNNNPFPIPENLVRAQICSLTGTLACEGCPNRFEFFIKGTEPKKTCQPEEVKKIIEEKAKASPTPQIGSGTSTSR